MKKRTKVILIFTFVFWMLVLIGLILFGFSFTKISVGSIALEQNLWTKQITRLLTPGLYHRGLTKRSITFSSVLQYIVYSNTSTNGPLELISQDMQPFKLDYTLGYRIIYDNLKLTYTKHQQDFPNRLKTYINNIIMSTMSSKLATEVWRSTTQDAILDEIFNNVGPIKSQYGVQIYGFWMSNIIFDNLEEYFSNSYVNSFSDSGAYKNSVNEINSLNVELGSLNTSLQLIIKQQNSTYNQNYIKGYTEYEVSSQKISDKKKEIAGYLNSIKNGTSPVNTYLSFRNFTEFVFS